ncbi:porin [Rhodobacteraceae bacterium]|nr:porin [Paracoccaceae bacterium]
MKKVLLTTTALVMTAGVASADVTFSGKAELTYGNWNTLGAGAETWGSTTDLGVSMSGEASGISYTASISIDESDSATAADIGGAITMSGSGLSLTYDADGEMDAGGASDELGDLQFAYSGAGVSASYTEDTSAGLSEIKVGYTAGDLAVGYATNNSSSVSALSAKFTAGDLAISVEGADTGAAWDASAAYTMGASTVTVGTDEASATYIKVATSLNDITLTAKALDTDNELSVGYTMGDITLSYAYDEGAGVAATDDGDDAQTIFSVSYDLGGVVLKGESNNMNEVQVSAAFTF